MTVIAGSAATVPTKGADEYAVADLKKDVSCSGFAQVLVRPDKEPAILALKESNNDSVETGWSGCQG